MLRTTRPFLRPSSRAIVLGSNHGAAPRSYSVIATSQIQTRQRTAVKQWPSSAALPLTWRIRYSTKPPAETFGPDKKLEKEAAQSKLEPHPELVSTESSVRHVFESSGKGGSGEKDVSSGVASDLKTVKETLALNSVPREPYILGLAGTLPYLATSVSTLYLGWNLRSEWPTSSPLLNSIMVSHETADQWLHMLESVQLGYGAVIISFLGAIHWGMEYAEKSPSHDRTRFRYGVGVLAPAVAWPTLLMPVHFALTTQFAAFTALYFVDARAASRGWAPQWYTTYRFVLTFVVGSAIFISLVGRAKVGDDSPRLGPDRYQEAMHQRGTGEEPYSEKWEKLEAEEKERLKKEKEEEERKKAEEEKAAKKKKGKKGKKDGKDGKQADKKEESEDEDQDEKSENQEDNSDDDESDGESDQGGDDDKNGDDEKKEDDDGDDDGDAGGDADEGDDSKQDGKEAEKKDDGKDKKPEKDAGKKKPSKK